MKPDRETTHVGSAGLRAGRALRRLREERGQAVTEFAMVLPLIALVVIVLVLFGKTLYIYIQATHDANEAARLASVNQPTTNVNQPTFAAFLKSEYALPGGANVAVCYPTNPATGTTREIGDPVEVDVWTGATWVPFLRLGQIKGEATMRLEQSTVGNTLLDATTTYDTTTHQCKT